MTFVNLTYDKGSRNWNSKRRSQLPKVLAADRRNMVRSERQGPQQVAPDFDLLVPAHESLHFLQGNGAIVVGIHCLEYALVRRLKLLQ